MTDTVLPASLSHGRETPDLEGLTDSPRRFLNRDAEMASCADSQKSRSVSLEIFSISWPVWLARIWSSIHESSGVPMP